MDWRAVFAVLLVAFPIASALQCYVCHDQDSNRDKCVKTTKQCNEYEDTCVSLVRWKTPPYWTPRGEKLYFISKNCDTDTACRNRKNRFSTVCKRDWYSYWTCVECCSGELCNYYVTLGAPSVVSGALTVVIAALTSVLIMLHR